MAASIQEMNLRRLGTCLISALLAACGGDSGGNRTGQEAGALSIQVTESQGAPLARVALSLTGASSSNGVTGPDGRHLYSSLMPGTYTVTPAGSSGITFSPMSARVTIGGNSIQTLPFVATYATTGQIESYAAQHHAQMVTTFLADDQAIIDQYTVAGDLTGLGRYQAEAADLTARVQAFVSDLLAEVRLQSQTLPVDDPAVSALLSSYSTADSTTVAALFGNVDSLRSLGDSTKTSIGAIYTSAASALP